LQKKQAELVNDDAVLFLQPEWVKKEEMTPLIVDYVMKNPKVSLQTHKYLIYYIVTNEKANNNYDLHSKV
jgi:hypothetical protein